MEEKSYFPRPERTPNIPVEPGMELYWNSNTGHWAFRPVKGYSAAYLKKDSFIPKKQETMSIEASGNADSGKRTTNASLNAAKKNKNDEFYTRMPEIADELKHYKNHFKGKVVYCPCDKAFELGRSNFVEFFIEHFVEWELKGLVATQYNEDGHGWKWVVARGDVNGNGHIDESEIDTFPLYDNGDFASDECKQIMRECDIVVTNPPFSLFRPFVSQLMELDKKFLIIGNQNAITCKEIFPLIQDNKIWTGYAFNKTMEFNIPDSYEKWDSIDENGNKVAKVPAVTWFTNLEHDKRKESLYLPQHYLGREEKYPIYDNYSGIEIGHWTKKGKWEGSLDEIPNDYYGIMGVPITFLNFYNPKQFEIVGFSQGDLFIECGGSGASQKFVDDYYKNGGSGQIGEGWKHIVFYADNGKPIAPYQRILIRRKK